MFISYQIDLEYLLLAEAQIKEPFLDLSRLGQKRQIREMQRLLVLMLCGLHFIP